VRGGRPLEAEDLVFFYSTEFADSEDGGLDEVVWAGGSSSDAYSDWCFEIE